MDFLCGEWGISWNLFSSVFLLQIKEVGGVHCLVHSSLVSEHSALHRHPIWSWPEMLSIAEIHASIHTVILLWVSTKPRGHRQGKGMSWMEFELMTESSPICTYVPTYSAVPTYLITNSLRFPTSTCFGLISCIVHTQTVATLHNCIPLPPLSLFP